MENIDIRFDTSQESRQFLRDGLEEYNFSKNQYLNPIKYKLEKKYFGFYSYDKEKVVGGAYGWIDDSCWTWLDLLYIDKNYRRYNIGTRLMNLVEEFAKENNCVGMRTETWSFQAKGFYEKMGFAVYSELEDHPPGAIDYSLKKILIKDKKDYPKPMWGL